MLQWFMGRPKSLKQEVRELREDTMAKFEELLTAIENNGRAVLQVLDAVLIEQGEIKTALEQAASGAVTPDQISTAISKLDENTALLAKAQDTVKQLIPTIPSPTEPTPTTGDTPSPIPTPVDPTDSAAPIVIAPSDNVGLDGSVSIDIP